MGNGITPYLQTMFCNINIFTIPYSGAGFLFLIKKYDHRVKVQQGLNQEIMIGKPHYFDGRIESLFSNCL